MVHSSCSQDHFAVESIDEQSLSPRSSVSCDNLLSNGDFESYTPLFDCVNLEFTNGLVPSWVDFGTSDLMSFEGSTVCNWGCVRYAHARSIAANESTTGAFHTEGLQQSVAVISDPDIYYSLSFEATPEISGLADGTISAYFLDGAPLFGDSTQTPDFSNAYKIIERNLDGPGCSAKDWPILYTNYIYPDQDYNNFFVYIRADSSTYSVVHDNYELLCHSRLLQSIKVDASPHDACSYTFSPSLLGSLTIMQYEWDFGDGTTSSSAYPAHTYSQPGIYTVSLTIKDADGCCTTVTTVVTCQNQPTFCSSYICWDEVGHTMGLDECVVGIRVLFPDCTEQDIPFVPMMNDLSCLDGWSPTQIPVPTPISENHCEIKQLIIAALASLNVDYVVLGNDPSVHQCLKGQYPIPGYFITTEGIQVIAMVVQNCTLGQTEYNLFNFNGSLDKNCFGC